MQGAVQAQQRSVILFLSDGNQKRVSLDCYLSMQSIVVESLFVIVGS